MMKPIGCGGTLITGQRGQLTGAFAYKCAFDLLYCWAEMPKSDVSDDMVMSFSTNCEKIVHGRRQCRASNFRPWY